MTTAPPQLPLGLVVPADVEAARELIDKCLALAAEEQRAREFIESMQREQTLEFAI